MSAVSSIESELRSWWTTARIYMRNVKGSSHEPETPYLQYVLGANDICLHVGASDGRHSYAMARHAPGGQIYAFEPSSYSVRVLRRLIVLHRLRSIKAFHTAVGEAAGHLTLIAPIKRNGHVGRSFGFVVADAAARRGDAGTSDAVTEKVPVITLDAFCAEHTQGRADFIRCDVEGSEFAVLKGAETLIKTYLPNLLIELHPPLLVERFGTTAETVRDWILAFGYRMFYLENGSIVERTALAPGPWKDYFFLHPSRASRLPPGVFQTAMRGA